MMKLKMNVRYLPNTKIHSLYNRSFELFKCPKTSLNLTLYRTGLGIIFSSNSLIRTLLYTFHGILYDITTIIHQPSQIGSVA